MSTWVFVSVNGFGLYVNFGRIISLVVALVVFLISIVFGPGYQYGDQAHYREIYAEIGGRDFFDAYSHYSLGLSSSEIVHFFLSWVASTIGVEKDLFISGFNGLFAFYVMRLFSRWKVNLIVSSFIVLTNFYFLVIFFSAERLKFGVFFVVLSLLFIERKRFFFFFSLLAFFSHVQVLIIYASIFLGYFSNVCRRGLTFAILRNLFVISIFSLLSVLFMYDHLVSKFAAYHRAQEPFDFFRMAIFFIMSFYYAKNRPQVVFVFIPMALAVFLVGDERVNLMGYFVFLYYALPVAKGINIAVISTSIYFAYFGLRFMNNISKYGTGFYFG